MTNPYSHVKLWINDSGRKGFPFVVCTATRCLGYFKNRNDAERYCATDGQAFV
jgi:hypothetical protein